MNTKVSCSPVILIQVVSLNIVREMMRFLRTVMATLLTVYLTSPPKGASFTLPTHVVLHVP